MKSKKPISEPSYMNPINYQPNKDGPRKSPFAKYLIIFKSIVIILFIVLIIYILLKLKNADQPTQEYYKSLLPCCKKPNIDEQKQNILGSENSSLN